MSAVIPEQRVAEVLRRRPGPRAVRERAARPRGLDPILAELVDVIMRGAKHHGIELTPGQVKALAAYIAPSLLQLPYTRRPQTHRAGSSVPRDKSTVKLTARERQSLMGLARGLTAEQTGYRLHLAKDTVKTHLRRAYAALGARNGCHAVAICIKHGLLNAEEIEDV